MDRTALRSLSQQGSVTYYNLGIRRETSTELASRWQAEAEATSGCDNYIVFSSFGTNDTTNNGKLRVVD